MFEDSINGPSWTGFVILMLLVAGFAMIYSARQHLSRLRARLSPTEYALMNWREHVQTVALLAMLAGFCWALWPFWTAPSLEWSLVATVTHVWSVYGWLASRPVRLLVAAPFMLWALSVLLSPPRVPPVAE